MSKLFFLLSMSFSIVTSAQVPENSIAAVYYTVSHIIDTTQPESPSKDEGVLYIGKNSSLYTSYNNIKSLKGVKEYRATHPGLPSNGWTANSGFPISFYKGVASGVLQSVSMLKESVYLLEEKSPKIDWSISKETKTVGSYQCQKATAIFQGRTWEVWFCSSLPFSNGPWKLGGLPGLILEAYDTKKEIVYAFKSLDDKDAEQAPIALPDNTIKTSKRVLEKAIEGLAASRQLGGGMMTTAGAPPPKRKEYNNPIDKTTDGN